MVEEEKVLLRIKEISDQAQRLYTVDLSQVYIRFDLLGTAAGQAGQMDDIQYIRLNRDMLRRGSSAFNHVYNETIPHEFAHLVCFMIPELGSGHDKGWTSVCQSLGGVGTRLHDEFVVYGKGVTYEYTTTTGVKQRVSQAVHLRVMQGHTYDFPRGKGTINNSCSYCIVGIRGKTLREPIFNPPPDICIETAFGVL